MELVGGCIGPVTLLPVVVVYSSVEVFANGSIFVAYLLVEGSVG